MDSKMYQLPQLVPGLDVVDVGSDVGEPIVATGVVKGAVQVDDVQGEIDGVRYVAAFTAGGGTCGLHAIWGRCTHEGAPLHANMARAFLLESVPSDVADMCRLQNGCLREAFLEMLHLVYTDQVLPVAAASESGAWERVRPADRQVWVQLPEEVQEECRAFVTAKAAEHENVKKNLDVRLQSFARDFFVDANEIDLVRPLCLILGFLNVEDDHDLRSHGASAEDFGFEGSGGGLELLHPCQEIPGLTKYQALFDPSPVADKIRISFSPDARTSSQRCWQFWQRR